MRLNPWKRNPQTAGENPGSSEVKAEFQAAAEQVAASEAPPPEPSPPSLAQKLEDLSVSEEHAREVVKFCFWPMAHYVDPLWALSDAEAQEATPRMQKFLQWLLLKYLPLFTLKLAVRFPELLGMLVTMALLAWHKSQTVIAAQSAKASGAALPGESEVKRVDGGAVPLIQCEICSMCFLTREALAGHLPCNPA